MLPVPLPSPFRFWKVLLALALLIVVARLAKGRQAQLKALAVDVALETPSRRRSYAELRRSLDEAGMRLERRVAQADDTEANRQQLRHIIGIERWGQSRLKVLGGSGFVMDGHRLYLPAESLDLAGLRQLASLTRAQTSDLVHSFGAQPPLGKVEHNSLGPLSARAWLRYLTLHAEFESRRLK
ncbi:DinB family protein [Deinococcus rubellus]|uniref:DinB family protein n=1 Tax=Deinococcus rubellus TaxID=1889240 RepID=A0ABY5YK61_9DEIO|nr:DinB family protein [Deinococcus rubellus]UWX64148.1 DinB family protein [Deinococcus rubellus]